MSEKYKSQERICFPKGQQGRFLKEVQQVLKYSDKTLAHVLGVHRRTVNGWKREEYLMPLLAAQVLSQKANVQLPIGVEAKSAYWYTRKGGQQGWRVVKEKYGRVPVDEEHRKRKWREWWNAIGQYDEHSVIGVSKKINLPRKSARLAEFVGIMIGDGGMSEYQLTVTLHKKDDREYADFVRKLIEDLFTVPVALQMHDSENACSLTVSRVQLVRYCQATLGLKVGDKIRQGLDIPDWIISREAYRASCLRGLMDTDGCIFNECHSIKEKVYCYPRLSFVSGSPPLISSVMEILQGLGYSPTKRGERKVQLEKRDEILSYFKLINTNNPKHLNRFREFTGGVG